MSAISKIEWTDKTWNPVRGCSVVSPGCHSCYAMKQAYRFSGPGRPYEGLTKQTKVGPQWTGAIRLVEEALLEPLRWRTPSFVFVNSMSDLFHEAVPNEFIGAVVGIVAATPQHAYQILTKRAERMRGVMSSLTVEMIRDCTLRVAGRMIRGDWTLPLRNLWLGVSIENQHFTDERIPMLLETTAAVRFVSAEPLLGPIDLEPYLLRPFRAAPNVTPDVPRLDWVIVGGESGPRARSCNVAWIRSIVRQCKDAGVPVFVKQLGSHWQGDPVRIRLRDRKGGDPSEWPEDLRVREWPRMVRPMEDDAA